MNLILKKFGEILANLWSNATKEAKILPNSEVNWTLFNRYTVEFSNNKREEKNYPTNHPMHFLK